MIPLLIGLTFVVFAIVRVGDANPAVLMAGPEATTEQIEAIEKELHWDEPIYVQYRIYMQELLHGDMGKSWVTGRPVAEEIRDRLAISLELYTIATFLAVLVGVTFGYLSALRANSVTDHTLRAGTLLGISIPMFWLALVLIYVLYFRFRLAPPPLGRLDIFLDRPQEITGAYLIDSILTGQIDIALSAAHHLFLPLLAIVIISGAAIAKQTRALVWEVRQSDYVKFARACGQSNRNVGALIIRNSLPGIVTFSAMVYSQLLGSSALIELIFSWGGLGSFGIRSILRADFAVVQGYVLTIGILTAAIYILTDILVAWIDPRVRLE